NYHRCQSKYSFSLYERKIMDNPCCFDTLSLEFPCFQIRFNKLYIQYLQQNINKSEDVEKYKDFISKYINETSEVIFGLFTYRKLNQLIDNIISRLRYNRISIILYFASLIFRIKNLETFLTLGSTMAITVIYFKL
ncbi:hypothetical protein H311_01368, partial [Anncaliia algerae PRA109]